MATRTWLMAGSSSFARCRARPGAGPAGSCVVGTVVRPAVGSRPGPVGAALLGPLVLDLLGEPAQRRVDRAVGEHPEAAEPQAELFAQLVAVDRGLGEQAEDRQLEHGRHPLPVFSRTDTWRRCHESLYRSDTSAQRSRGGSSS